MMLNVAAERFRDEPVVFRPFLGTDYLAEVDGLRAGWILYSELRDTPTWWWTMTGPCCGHGRISSCGESRSLDDAMDSFREAFERWRHWALSEPEPVRWFGAAYQVPESAFLPKSP
jgi:hypothetical protein